MGAALLLPSSGSCEVLNLPSFWGWWLWHFPLNPNLWTPGSSSFHTHSTEETEGQRGNITYPQWHSWWPALVPSLVLLLLHVDCKGSESEQGFWSPFCTAGLELTETSFFRSQKHGLLSSLLFSNTQECKYSVHQTVTLGDIWVRAFLLCLKTY